MGCFAYWLCFLGFGVWGLAVRRSGGLDLGSFGHDRGDSDGIVSHAFSSHAYSEEPAFPLQTAELCPQNLNKP